MPQTGLDDQFQNTVTYRYDFFSGANIGVWVGPMLLSEAVAVEFSLSQSKRPLWGWASQKYDAVANGVVQCSGMLYMNFRQAHLMNAVIDNAQHAKQTYADKGEEFETDELQAAATYGLHDLTDDQISGLRSWYWGSIAGDFTNYKVSPYANPDFVTQGGSFGGARRPDDHEKGFDVHILYGDFWGQRGNNTTRALYNVHLTGFGQTIEIDGKPILEVYPFFCREAR